MGLSGGLAALGIAGGMVNAYGQIKQGSAEAEANNYAAQVAENNADISRQQALWAAQIGAQDVSTSQMGTAAKVGAIEANQGASGVTIGEGSNADVVESARRVGMQEAMTIRANAVRQAYGFQVQASNDEAQAQLDRIGAKQAKKSAYINAASTLLSSASQSSNLYNNYLNKKSTNLGGG